MNLSESLYRPPDRLHRQTPTTQVRALNAPSARIQQQGVRVHFQSTFAYLCENLRALCVKVLTVLTYSPRTACTINVLPPRRISADTNSFVHRSFCFGAGVSRAINLTKHTIGQ